MIKHEISLLLFFECRAVDHSGRIKTSYMNAEDIKIAERWNEEGFVSFGQIASEDLNEFGSHWCHLSDEAWRVAAAERKARAGRLWIKRNWKTTEEKRESENYHECR